MTRHRLFTLIPLALLVFSGIGHAQSLVSRYVEGQHYQALDEPVAQSEDGDVQVIEFFLYSCPHCYDLEPELHEWSSQLGDDVDFKRVPVLFGAAGQMYAKLYYTAEALGVLEDVHGDIFDAIHQQGRLLQSKSDMRAFMVEHGVDGDRFDALFDSEEVADKVREAGEIMRAFRVAATPSLGVAGRYWISGRSAGSNDAMFDVADHLIRRQQSQDGA